MSLNTMSSIPFQSPPHRMDFTHSFESPSAQIIFDPSPHGSYLEDVSRTAPLEHHSASSASDSSPAPASLVRLDRLSALVGIRGSVNPFFELHLFIQDARKLLLPLVDTFSDSVLTEILEKFLTRYLISDTSSYDESDVSDVSSSSPMLVSPTAPPTQASASDSHRDILSQSQHRAPVCASSIPSSIQKFLREHSAYRMFGTRSMHKYIDPMTLVTLQQMVGDLIIPVDDSSLALFLRTHFLPLPKHDEVNDHFKSKIYMKSIRTNTWDATTPALLWSYYDNFYKELNIFQSYFSSLSADHAFRMQRSLFCQGLQPYVLREAMLQSVTSMVLDSHRAIHMRFTELIHKVVTCSSFTAVVAAKEKKTYVDNKKASDHAAVSPAVAPVAKAPAAGGSNSKPPWKGKVAAVKKVLFSPDDDLLDLSEVSPSPASSFPFALIDSGFAVHTAPSSSFLIDPISSLDSVGTTLTAANGTSIASSSIISGKISPTLPIDNVFITPSIPFPIVSVSSLCSDNNLVLFSSHSATIIPKNDLILSKFNSFLDFASNQSTTILAPLDPTDNLYKLPLCHLSCMPIINNSSALPVSLNSCLLLIIRLLYLFL